ncbi:MAG: DUF21 domain-containing protein, partial [Caldithrix sp.]|nr:DUF21 domain-containing protein [Caldithrix sp.]
MDPSSLIYALVFILLLIGSAFFSGSETTFLSLRKTTVKSFSKSKNLSHRQVAHLLSDSQKLLISIIIGNTIVNVSVASLAAVLTSRASIRLGVNPALILLLNVVVVTGVILFFSEIIPKVSAVRNPRVLAPKLAYPLTFFYYLFYPISVVFSEITNWLSKSIKT